MSGDRLNQISIECFGSFSDSQYKGGTLQRQMSVVFISCSLLTLALQFHGGFSLPKIHPPRIRSLFALTPPLVLVGN